MLADSCGTLDHDVDLALCYRNDPVHDASESLRGSFDSTSRSHATVLDQLPPPELLQGKNKRVGDVSPAHSTGALSDTSTSVEEAGVSSKDDDAACPGLSMDNASKIKCLQVTSISLYAYISLIFISLLQFLYFYTNYRSTLVSLLTSRIKICVL